MASIRVTPGLLVDRVLRNLNDQSRRIMRLQDQLSTGLRILGPSDDPVAVRRAVSTRADVQRGTQYLENITGATPSLAQADSSLRLSLDLLARARELTTQAANDTFGPDERLAIAEEIDQILEDVFNASNVFSDDRYLFSGTNTLTQPFEATRNANGEITAVTYAGNDEPIEVAIGDGIEVPINVTGSAAYLSSQDLFQTLIDTRDNMRANDGNALRGPRLQEMEAAQEQLLRGLARLGGVTNRVDRAEVAIEDRNLALEELLSQTRDVDFVETITELNAQSNAYRAALDAAARVIQPSLLDFVR